MTDAARYVKIVEWSDADGAFVGQCPGVIGPCCHGPDEAEVYRELCQIVEEWVATPPRRPPAPAADRRPQRRRAPRVTRLDSRGFRMVDEFAELEAYLRRVPAIGPANAGRAFGKGRFPNGNWYVKFSIAIDHPLAWHAVQELGNVLNYLSVNERLPTVFMPVSPPSYLNGGPRQFLSWVIESTTADFTPKMCAEWLEGRLPRPVDDISQWSSGD